MAIAWLVRPCWAAGVCAVVRMVNPFPVVAKVVWIRSVVTPVAEPVFAARVVTLGSRLEAEKFTLKVPRGPDERQVFEVGFTTKAVVKAAVLIGPTVVPSTPDVISGIGIDAFAVVSLPKKAPNAQVAALTLPATSRVDDCAKALVPTKDKAASAAKALGKFFMVISFKVKKGIF